MYFSVVICCVYLSYYFPSHLTLSNNLHVYLKSIFVTSSFAIVVASFSFHIFGVFDSVMNVFFLSSSSFPVSVNKICFLNILYFSVVYMYI